MHKATKQLNAFDFMPMNIYSLGSIGFLLPFRCDPNFYFIFFFLNWCSFTAYISGVIYLVLPFTVYEVLLEDTLLKKSGTRKGPFTRILGYVFPSVYVNTLDPLKMT